MSIFQLVGGISGTAGDQQLVAKEIVPRGTIWLYRGEYGC
jgi:hypothetical protein